MPRNNKAPRAVRLRKGRRDRSRPIPILQVSERSQLAHDRALHALAAMRKDPKLSLTRAAKMHGVRQETIKKHFPSALKKEKGRFRASKSDRYRSTLYVPGADGQPVPVQTRTSSERRQLSNYLRDVGRYLRGNRNALFAWRGKKIAGVELVTNGRTLKAIEPALSDFSLYRSLNGGAE